MWWNYTSDGQNWNGNGEGGKYTSTIAVTSSTRNSFESFYTGDPDNHGQHLLYRPGAISQAGFPIFGNQIDLYEKFRVGKSVAKKGADVTLSYLSSGRFT